MNAVTTITADQGGPDRRRDSLLRIAEVKRRTGLSVATIYRRKAEGTFPAAVELGPRMVGWYESDVAAWIADRKPR